MNRIVVNLEALGRLGQTYPLHDRVLEVEQLATALTKQMVVPFPNGVEAHDCIGVKNFLGSTHSYESVEHAVDRRPREAWETLLHGLVYLIRRRVIGALDELFQDDATLDGHGEPLLPAYLLVDPEPLFPGHS